MKPLKENFDKVSAGVDHSFTQDFVDAVSLGNARDLRRLLALSGLPENMDALFKEKTALTICANRNYIDCLRLLIDAGADMDAANESGTTPLMCAAVFGHFECAETLVKAGANIDLQNERGSSALAISVIMREIDVFKLLIKANANVLLRNDSNKTVLDYDFSNFDNKEFEDIIKQKRLAVNKSKQRKQQSSIRKYVRRQKL